MSEKNNMRAQDYEKIAEIDEKLKKDENNLDFLLQKAFVYFDRYDDENAIETYQYIIRLYPQCIDAYLWLAYYLHRVGCDPLQAIEVAKEGLKIDPNNGGLYAIMGWSLDWYPARHNEMLEYLRKAIELEPTWISTRISLIGYLIKQKQFNEAKKEIKIALGKIQDDFPEPRGEMEEAYESCITRRRSKSAKQTLLRLLDDVDRMPKDL